LPLSFGVILTTISASDVRAHARRGRARFGGVEGKAAAGRGRLGGVP